MEMLAIPISVPAAQALLMLKFLMAIILAIM